MAKDHPVMTSEGDWYACKECVELITLEKWNELANHAAEVYLKTYGSIDDYLFKEIVRVHQLFRKYRKQEN